MYIHKYTGGVFAEEELELYFKKFIQTSKTIAEGIGYCIIVKQEIGEMGEFCVSTREWADRRCELDGYYLKYDSKELIKQP